LLLILFGMILTFDGPLDHLRDLDPPLIEGLGVQYDDTNLLTAALKAAGKARPCHIGHTSFASDKPGDCP